MMKKYTPRRAGKRWRESAPEYVMDCFDNGGQSCDRYTVLFCGSLLISDGTFAETYVPYLSMSGAPSHPQGVSLLDEMRAYEAADYRYHCKHHRIRWLDLPEHIRNHVMARVEEN